MEIHLGYPQVIWLVLLAFSLTNAGINHKIRKPSTGNVWVTLAASVLVLGLLYWGGFFTQGVCQ
jgi:hypothetical protein